jgi:putative nucleotidyltransferase with HDIG domain
VVEWAERSAQELLAPLSTRWRHTLTVAATARQIAVVVDEADRELLIAAAYLHDIGYSPSVTQTGFHPLDGARYLANLGVPERLYCLVAHHSGAIFEAEQRGLSKELAEFDREDSPVMDALVYADMTTGPQGQPVSFEDRISEILARYVPRDPVHRAISRAKPVLGAAVERTVQRLRGFGGLQPI